MKLLKLLLFVFLLIVGGAFAVLNAQSVQLDFYFWIIDLPLSVVLIGFVSAGVLLGVIASSGIMLKLKHENSGLKRKASLVHEEVKNLRTLPIRDN